jgi:DNA-directed RNA polymerase specialized sigma24 family protein
VDRDDQGFEAFFRTAEPRLRRAFVATHGTDRAADATAEALAWAWEHWERVTAMENPVGYLFRVGQSKTRPRRTPRLPTTVAVGEPDLDPTLVPALLRLSPAQRTAVWLVHGCQWRYAEVAEAMGISASAVGTHVSRALESLRRTLAVAEVDGA